MALDQQQKIELFHACMSKSPVSAVRKLFRRHGSSIFDGVHTVLSSPCHSFLGPSQFDEEYKKLPPEKSAKCRSGERWMEWGEQGEIIDLLEFCIKQGMPTDLYFVENIERSSLLACASRWSRLEVMSFLIGAGADVNGKGIQVPLHEATIGAIEKRSVAALDLLIQSGALVDKTNKWGETALFRYHLEAGLDLNVASFLVGKGANPLLKADGERSLFHKWCQPIASNWDLPAVEWLIDKGVDPFAKDLDGADAFSEMSCHLGDAHLIRFNRIVKAAITEKCAAEISAATFPVKSKMTSRRI